MIPEKMLELIILHLILRDYHDDKEYREFIDGNYNKEEISNRYVSLGIEFLNRYALDKTEKLD